MVADIGASGGYCASAGSCGIVLRRATLYRVIPREGRVSIASASSDRPGRNARRHAASEIEMEREVGSRVAVLQHDIGYAAASAAGQGQIACRD